MTNTEKPSAIQEQEDLAEVYRSYAEGKRITDLASFLNHALLGPFLARLRSVLPVHESDPPHLNASSTRRLRQHSQRF